MLNNAGGGEQNFGGTLSFAPVGNVDVAVGLLSSDGASGDTTNIVATWNGAMANGGLTTTFEYTENDTSDGWGITAQYSHGSHGLTVRYDDVDGSNTTTVAASYSVSDNLGLVLEVNDDDATGNGQVLLEAIATF